MKIIAIGAVTAGGKTTLVNAIKDKLKGQHRFTLMTTRLTEK